MKNLRHLRIFIIPFFFSLFSCSENDKEHLTREITKVETSYFEGCSKVEGPTSIKKIETSAPDWFIQRSSDQAQEKINKLMQERSRTALARTIYSGYDVGVIPRYDACPSWSEKITIFMDCEDSSPDTGWLSCGLPQSQCDFSWDVDGNRNLRMVFCRVDGRLFKDSGWGPYGILRLGTQVLPGSDVLTRRFDNEDRNNKNSHQGDILPNISDANTILQFHAFANYSGAPSMDMFPVLGFEYAVFHGLASQAGASRSILFIDDEDNDNTNSLKINGQPYDGFPSIPWLITNKNTQLSVVGYFQ